MPLSKSVKPISYVKAHASEVINNVIDTREPVFITQNGEAKVVLQDLREYEEERESLAMLKLIAQSKKNFEDGEYSSAEDAFSELDRKVAERRAQYDK